jgi:hypothetical protein
MFGAGNDFYALSDRNFKKGADVAGLKSAQEFPLVGQTLVSDIATSQTQH